MFLTKVGLECLCKGSGTKRSENKAKEEPHVRAQIAHARVIRTETPHAHTWSARGHVELLEMPHAGAHAMHGCVRRREEVSWKVKFSSPITCLIGFVLYIYMFGGFLSV